MDLSQVLNFLAFYLYNNNKNQIAFQWNKYESVAISKILLVLRAYCIQIRYTIIMQIFISIKILLYIKMVLIDMYSSFEDYNILISEFCGFIWLNVIGNLPQYTFLYVQLPHLCLLFCQHHFNLILNKYWVAVAAL